MLMNALMRTPNQPRSQESRIPIAGEDHEDDDGDREEMAPVRLVELPRLAEHAAQGIHARQLTGRVGRKPGYAAAAQSPYSDR